MGSSFTLCCHCCYEPIDYTSCPHREPTPGFVHEQTYRAKAHVFQTVPGPRKCPRESCPVGPSFDKPHLKFSTRTDQLPTIMFKSNPSWPGNLSPAAGPKSGPQLLQLLPCFCRFLRVSSGKTWRAYLEAGKCYLLMAVFTSINATHFHSLLS